MSLNLIPSSGINTAVSYQCHLLGKFLGAIIDYSFFLTTIVIQEVNLAFSTSLMYLESILLNTIFIQPLASLSQIIAGALLTGLLVLHSMT